VDGVNQQFECNGNAFMRNNRFVRNIVVSRHGHMIRVNRWAPAVFAECDYNLYWRPGAGPGDWKGTFPTGDFAAWQKAGFDVHSVIADPGFANPAHDEYALGAASPAWKLGFRRIPVERIGARGWKSK
jgi:hypothetical protein